jgi:hypothetical protein
MRRRAASKRSERGIVMVESIAVIVILTISLAALWFIHNCAFYKLDAMREAKNRAWGTAMLGCGPSAGPSGDSIEDTVNQADSDNPIPEGSNVDESKSHTVTGPGGKTFEMNASTKVVCNEQTSASYGLEGILEWAVKEIAQGGFF